MTGARSRARSFLVVIIISLVGVFPVVMKITKCFNFPSRDAKEPTTKLQCFFFVISPPRDDARSRLRPSDCLVVHEPQVNKIRARGNGSGSFGMAV